MIRRAICAVFLVCIAAPAIAADEKAKAAPPSDQDDPIGRKLSEQIGPFPQPGPFGLWVGDRDPKKTREAWQNKYESLTLDEKIHYGIFQLRNECWFENDHYVGLGPYSTAPEGTPTRELIKLGKPAIPQLIRALDSHVVTKIQPTRHIQRPWLVQDATLNAIETIACRHFGSDVRTYSSNGIGEEEWQKIRKDAAAWWEQNKGADAVQWAKDALLSKTAAHGECRDVALDSLYRRLGKESYPFLAKAYHRLPKGGDDANRFDETMETKLQILQRLLEFPTKNDKAVFTSAVHDAPLWIRIDGAEGLWAIGDPSGLELMVKETEERLLTGQGSDSFDCEYDNMVSFLKRCNTPRSREAVCKCLRGRNPYLRKSALDAVASLRMERAVRVLPELFDDPFVLYGSYTESSGNVARLVPAERICDRAAETFTKVVPDAPRFDGTTAEEQQASIEKLKQWWKENSSKLKWNEKRGMLLRPAKER